MPLRGGEVQTFARIRPSGKDVCGSLGESIIYEVRQGDGDHDQASLDEVGLISTHVLGAPAIIVGLEYTLMISAV